MAGEIFSDARALLEKQLEQAVKMLLIVKVPRLSGEEISQYMSRKTADERKSLCNKIGPNLYALNSESDNTDSDVEVIEQPTVKPILSVSLLDTDDEDNMDLNPSNSHGSTSSPAACEKPLAIKITSVVCGSGVTTSSMPVSVAESSVEITKRSLIASNKEAANSETSEPACSIADSPIAAVEESAIVNSETVPLPETSATATNSTPDCSVEESSMEVDESSLIASERSAPGCSAANSSIAAVEKSVIVNSETILLPETAARSTPDSSVAEQSTEVDENSSTVSNPEIGESSSNETVNSETSASTCSVITTARTVCSNETSLAVNLTENASNILERSQPDDTMNVESLVNRIEYCTKEPVLKPETKSVVHKFLDRIIESRKNSNDPIMSIKLRNGLVISNFPNLPESTTVSDANNQTVASISPAEESTSATVMNSTPKRELRRGPSIIEQSTTVGDLINEAVDSMLPVQSASRADRNISSRREPRSPSAEDSTTAVVSTRPIHRSVSLSMPSLDPTDIPIPDVPKLRVKSEATLGTAEYNLLINAPIETRTTYSALANTERNQLRNVWNQTPTVNTVAQSMINSIVDHDRELSKNTAKIAVILKNLYISKQSLRQHATLRIPNSQLTNALAIDNEMANEAYNNNVKNRAAEVAELIEECLKLVNVKSLWFQIHSDFQQIMMQHKKKNTTIFKTFFDMLMSLCSGNPESKLGGVLNAAELERIMVEIQKTIIDVPEPKNRKRAVSSGPTATREPVKSLRTETVPYALEKNYPSQPVLIASTTSHPASTRSPAANYTMATPCPINSNTSYSASTGLSIAANSAMMASHSNTSYTASPSSAFANNAMMMSLSVNSNTIYSASTRPALGYPNHQTFGQSRFPIYNPNSQATNMSRLPTYLNANMRDSIIVCTPNPNTQATMARTLPTCPNTNRTRQSLMANVPTDSPFAALQNHSKNILLPAAACDVSGGFAQINENVPVPNMLNSAMAMYRGQNPSPRNPPPPYQHIVQRVANYPNAIPDRLSPAANRRSPGSPINQNMSYPSQFVYSNSAIRQQYPNSTQPSAVPSYPKPCTDRCCQQTMYQNLPPHHQQRNEYQIGGRNLSSADQAFFPAINNLNMSLNGAANVRYSDKPLSVQIVNSSLSPNAGPSPSLVTSSEMPISVPIVQSSSSPNIDEICLKNMTEPFLKDSEFDEFMKMI